MDLFTLISISLTFIVVYFASLTVPKLWRDFRIKRHLLKIIPSPAYHWFLGHLGVFPGPNAGGLQWHIDKTKLHSRYYMFLTGPIGTGSVLLNHPETIKKLTNTTEPKQLRDSAYGFIKAWIGDGLLVSSGAKWHRNRRLLTPGFHFEILKQYFDVYNNCADVLLNNFEKYAIETEKSMDVFKPVGLCTFDIILQCALSSNLEVQNMEKESAYHEGAGFLGRKVLERCFKPHLYSDTIYALTSDGRAFHKACEYSHEFADDIIANRKKTLADEVQKPRGKMTDFLDILLLARDDNGTGLTDLEIRDEVETFMFEGHDTTKSAIAWCLYNLAKHPEIQSRARDEVNAVLHGRTDRRIEADDMTSLPYLTRCIKESMRTHPAVPFIGRTLENELEIDPGKVLPPGTSATVMIWNLHHNPDVWPDHMTYDPDRFLPENVKHMDSHAFLPFSAGPRNCIGQHFAMNEIRTLVSRILDRFTLRLDPEREATVHPDIVLRPADGIYLYFSENS